LVVEDAIPYPELKQRINSITNFEKKAFFCTLYATGARIGEICGHKKHPNRKYPTVIKDYTGLTVNNVEEKEMDVIDGKDIVRKPFLVITVETEKHPNHPFRAIPINCSEEPWLTEPIKQIIRLRKMQGKTKVFDFTTRWGQILCKDYLGVHPHLLRHSRATHWVKHFGLDKYVQKLLGHKFLSSTSFYLHLNPSDAAMRMVFR